MLIFRIGRSAGIATIFLFLSTAASSAGQDGGVVQGPPPRDRVVPLRSGTGAVRGRVLDGVTGAAIARARVTLQGGKRAVVTTDASGVFEFTNLPMGPVTISADKPTYLPARFPSPGRTIRSSMRPLVLGDGQMIDNVTIAMFHGASISGRVLDANGDLLDNAQINVLRIPAAGRVGRPTQRGGASTDDRGEFRIGRLEAGTYLIQVTVRRQQPFADSMAVPETPVPALPLPTFYPGVLAIDQAQPITLEKGQAVTDVDIVVAEGTPGIVNGIVTSSTGAPLDSTNGYVNVRRVMSESSLNFDSFVAGVGLRPDGTFRLVLPPGDYLVEAGIRPRTMNGPPPPGDEQVGTAKITVAGGGEDSVAIAVGPGATASGRVVFETTSPPPPSPGTARVPLFSENGQCRSGQATIAADWTFKVDGLNGTCSAPPMASFGRWMIKAVIVNGENAMTAPITFQSGQQLRNVQVIVTDKHSDMIFRVSDGNGQSTRDYVVLVFPIDKSRWVTGARIFVGPSDAASSMTAMMRPANAPGLPAQLPPRREAMSGLSLGEYFVVAVDDMEPDDSRDPMVLDRLRSSSVRVTLVEGLDTEVALRRVSFADAMGKR